MIEDCVVCKKPTSGTVVRCACNHPVCADCFVKHQWETKKALAKLHGTKAERAVVVAGSRGFNDYAILKRELDAVKDQIDIIVSGGARGADTLGERWAKENDKAVWRMPADWSLGKSAGYIRNTAMAMRADAAFVFWDGESKGSRNMIETMMKMNKPCRVVQCQKGQ